MDQPIDPARAPVQTATLGELFDVVTCTHIVRRVEHPGREAVVGSSVTADRQLNPLGAALKNCWKAAEDAGLNTMTINEIDDDIAACRRESKAAQQA